MDVRLQRELKSGNYICSDGTMFNVADSQRDNYVMSISNHILNNGASVVSHRNTISQGTTYVGFSVPEGRRLFVFQRGLYLGEGEYNVDVVSADYNKESGVVMVRSPLNDDFDCCVNTEVRYGVTGIENEVVEEFGYVDVGNVPGTSRPSGAIASTGVTRIVTRDRLVRIQKLDSGSSVINATWILWECNRC